MTCFVIVQAVEGAPTGNGTKDILETSIEVKTSLEKMS
jgi:hypothetical protein